MLIVEDRYLSLPSLQVWFPETREDVLGLLGQAPTLTVMQCSTAVAVGLDAYAFRTRPFHTTLIDLSLSDEQLWSRLEKKTCRYQINKARKLQPQLVVNDRLDEAYALINDFIVRQKYRPPMSAREWARIVATNDVFVAVHDDRAMAAHVVLDDAPARVRALISATAGRADPADRAVVSALNRWLHWSEFAHYRALGVRCYDFGGIVLDPQVPEYSISQFKLTFGGSVATHHILRLAGNPLVRTALRGASAYHLRGKPASDPGSSQDGDHFTAADQSPAPSVSSPART